MRDPILRGFLDDGELAVDNFAGGGGASTGIETALGCSPDFAINHDPEAIAMHAANHPDTKHFCESVWDIDPVKVCAGRPVGVAWFSPDCKHFSKCKGGRPRDQKIRGLADVVHRWTETVRPRIVFLENVEEFKDWGPLNRDGHPSKRGRGLEFRRWIRRLEAAGYVVDHRELRACDYGAPTSRKRLFVIARCDGQPIVWPEPTHGPGLLPYRTAADCIDWSLPCPSIFERARPLKDATLRRIARGIMRYVIGSAKPFIVPLTHPSDVRTHSVDEPFRTITGAHRGEHALVQPFVVNNMAHNVPRDVGEPMATIATGNHKLLVAPFVAPVKSWGGGGNDPRSIDEPMRTTTTSKRGEHALIAPTLIQTGYGEREGQAPRSLDIEKPIGTMMAQGIKHGLVAALLAKHYGGVVGQEMDKTIGTVTSVDHHSLVSAHLLKFYGTSQDGAPADAPMPTVTAGGDKGGGHIAEVRAFLLKYYGSDQDPRLEEPLHTITTRDRFALVTVAGEEYVIADIGMRMLSPRELFRAQGFGDHYRIDPEHAGKPLSKTAQVRMCGNSVCPPLAAAIVAANCQRRDAARRVA